MKKITEYVFSKMGTLMGLILLVFILTTMQAFAQNTKVFLERGGAKQVIVSGGELEVRTGGLIDMQAGSTLTVNEAATINIADAPTFSDITVTYGVGAATGVFSGAVTGASFGATGALTGATLATTGAGDINGAVTMGADGTVSTITAAGAAAFHTSVTAPAVTGSTSVSGAKVSVTAGPLALYSRSEAQILAIDPVAAGELYFCSDCTTTAVCVSTGTAVLDFAAIEDPAAACD